jgi:hypothetical protein
VAISDELTQSGPVFLPSDSKNLPLQNARARFLDQFAEHAPVFENLADSLLPIWGSMDAEARDECLRYGWSIIDASPTLERLDPKLKHDEEVLRKQAVGMQLVKLRSVIVDFCDRFHLLLREGAPAVWIVETIIHTLHLANRRPPGQHITKWVHMEEMNIGYPQPEPEFRPVDPFVDQEDLFAIHIKIPFKRADESFPRFERRFNKICREARDAYVKDLKSQGWTNRKPFANTTWIDYLARWQAGGVPASKIYPKASSAAGRVDFSRRTKEAASYIGIARRTASRFPGSGSGR